MADHDATTHTMCFVCHSAHWTWYRYAGELAKEQLDAAEADHRQQQGLLNAYALEAGPSMASSRQQGGSNGSSNGGSSRGSATQPMHNPVRIVGMSATLPNAEEVSSGLSGLG